MSFVDHAAALVEAKLREIAAKEHKIIQPDTESNSVPINNGEHPEGAAPQS